MITWFCDVVTWTLLETYAILLLCNLEQRTRSTCPQDGLARLLRGHILTLLIDAADGTSIWKDLLLTNIRSTPLSETPRHSLAPSLKLYVNSES